MQASAAVEARDDGPVHLAGMGFRSARPRHHCDGGEVEKFYSAGILTCLPTFLSASHCFHSGAW